MELLSRLDYFDIGRRHVLGNARHISPSEVNTRGSNVNIMLGAASYMAHTVAQQNAESMAAHLLDACEDEMLDRWGWDRYQELGVRKGASASVVVGQIARPNAAAGAGSIPIGTKVLAGGIEYITTTTANLSVGQLATTADLRAVQAGKEFQVGRHRIDRFAKPETLFDASLTIDNEEPAAGGEPAESNDSFRERLRSVGATLRRGTLGAIVAGALSVSGVDTATALEVLDAQGRPARFVELFIADSSGIANAALAARVRVALEEWRAGGIYVGISGSTPVLAEVVLRLRFRAGVNTAALSDQIRQAVVVYVNSLPVNGPLFRSELGAVLTRFKAQGLILGNDTIVVPVGDLIPELGTTLRIRPEGVTLT